MLTRASLTIRLHPDDDVVIARKQLVGGTRVADEDVTVSGLIPPGHKIATHAIAAGVAGQALQPDHRFREPRHRRRRARASAQPGDGALRPRLRLRRRREADAICADPGDVRRHRPRRRPGGDAQLHRHPVDGQLLGHRRARNRRSFQARKALRIPQCRRRRRADPRQRLRHGHQGRRHGRYCAARSAATHGTRISPPC